VVVLVALRLLETHLIQPVVIFQLAIVIVIALKTVVIITTTVKVVSSTNPLATRSNSVLVLTAAATDDVVTTIVRCNHPFYQVHHGFDSVASVPLFTCSVDKKRQDRTDKCAQCNVCVCEERNGK
jgi:hypothetical protein